MVLMMVCSTKSVIQVILLVTGYYISLTTSCDTKKALGLTILVSECHHVQRHQ
jgi:hypothetical protein